MPSRWNAAAGLCLLLAFLALACSHPVPATHLYVYAPVPGLAASDQYAFRVRTVGASTWTDAFAFITRSPTVTNDANAYWSALNGWSHTYTNFETDSATEIEVRRVDGTPISTAVAHPTAKAQSLRLMDGKAYVTIAGPGQIALDIDGQMDGQDTGLGPGGVYAGPPITTVSIFANPLLNPRPSPTAPGTLAVMPGQTPPSTGDWQTLYFMPGVHDVGLAFPIHAGKSYYIPGDAIVYGTFNNETFSDGHDIHLTGYGTLSGERLTHPSYTVPPATDPNQYGSIYDSGAYNFSIQGLTLIDPAFHAVIAFCGLDPSRPTDYQWVKILGWRKNGDGINLFSNGRMEDSFIRTQDDSSYVNGRGMSRVVFWNDANGSALVLSALPNSAVTVDDIDVIYARAHYNKWSGGRIFNMRGAGGGASGSGVVFSNIRLEDSRPTLQAFFVAMGDVAPYLSDQDRDAGVLSGVRFQDISLAAPSVLGEPDLLWGTAIAPIQNLTFDNLTLAGTPITDAGHFTTNAYVTGLSLERDD